MASRPADPFAPSVFTPFLRRFTDEKATDLRDTQELYARVGAMHYRSNYTGQKGDIEIGGEIWGRCRADIPEHLEDYVIQTIHALLQHERVIFEFPEVNLKTTNLSLKESVDLRHFLRAKEHFHTHEEKVVALLTHGLVRLLSAIGRQLPTTFAPSPFTIPLIFLLPEPRPLIDQVYGELWLQPYVDNGLFVEVSRQMYLNLCEVSGIADPQEPKRPFKTASKNDAPLEDLVAQYFKGTPFHPFFLAPIPLQFRHEERFSHMHVVGGTGAGKTTLLQNLILNDLDAENPPALVVVDSQGDLIDKLSHLAHFHPDGGRLTERFLLITPKDIDNPPALNVFDVDRSRLGRYTKAQKEQVVAGVIQTFDYLFTGLLGADLTAKQSVFFRFVARLLLALPETMGRNATILDMLALMEDIGPYQAAVESLPEIQKRFFKRDFASKTFAQTKEQIRYRLNAILENPTMARLFTSPETKIDIFNELNRGSIIFVDTAKDFLKGASAHFGRIFISLVLQAALERAAIRNEAERRPAFLIVDEAAAYFDSNIDDLLTETRKYKLGCLFAHQYLDQATSSLRASLAANTAIKFTAGLSTNDARAMAPDMRTSADFIQSQPKLHFAAHIRNITPNAVSIPVEVGLLERQPRMSQHDYERLLERNRLRVTSPPKNGEPDAGPTDEPPRPSEGPNDSSATTGEKEQQESRPQSEDSSGLNPGAATDEW